MKKLSSYQKLKQEISRLRAENHILLDNEDHAEIAGMRMRHQMKKDIEKMAMLGDSSKPVGLGGVFGLMESFSKNVDHEKLNADDSAFRTDFKTNDK